MFIKRWLRKLPSVSFIALALFLPTYARAENEPVKNDEDVYNWVPWFEMGGYYGNVRTRSESTLWAPLYQTNDALIFTDLRFKAFEDDAREGNFALGYRQMYDGFNLGFWAGFDTRKSQLGRRFNQIAGGFEILSHNFDLRTNAYIPLNKSELVQSSTVTQTQTTINSTVDTSGDFVSIFNTAVTETNTSTFEVREQAMYGVDAEIGVRLPLEKVAPQLGFDPSYLSNADVRIYAGGYYFDSDQVDEEILGPRMRLEVRFEDILPALPGSRLTAEAEYQYDSVRDHQYEFGLRLRVPFYGEGTQRRLADARAGVGSNYGTRYSQPTARQLQARRMTDGLERDTDVVHQSQSRNSQRVAQETERSRENALDPVTGVRLDRLTYVSARSNLDDVATRVGSNTLIIASGHAGAFVNQSVSLEKDQTLVGGGSRVNVVGSQSNRRVSFLAPGSRPTIVQTTNSAALVIDDNSHVVGINIQGGGDGAGTNNRGIETSGARISGFAIDDVDIQNTDGHGVRLHSYVTDYSINNVTISNVTHGNGLDIESRNTGFSITNSTFSDISGQNNDAVLLARGNEGVLSNNTFGQNIADAAVRVTSDNTLSGTGNNYQTGQRLCEQFEGGNIIDVIFNGITGCD